MPDVDCTVLQVEQPAGNGEVGGSSPSDAASAEEEIARLSELLGITLSRGKQLTGQTVGDLGEATSALCGLVDDIKALRRVLGPFAEIARRLGWDKYDRDSMELGQHVIEAPVPEIEVAYCLTVGAFWRAAHLLDGDVDFDHPPGSTFAPRNRSAGGADEAVPPGDLTGAATSTANGVEAARSPRGLTEPPGPVPRLGEAITEWRRLSGFTMAKARKKPQRPVPLSGSGRCVATSSAKKYPPGALGRRAHAEQLLDGRPSPAAPDQTATVILSSGSEDDIASSRPLARSLVVAPPGEASLC